jgi:manganese-dependent inorganic pyrophosphatase
MPVAPYTIGASRQIVRDDFKEFVLGGERIGIGQIQVMHVDALADRKPDILREMRAVRDESRLVQVILMITDSSTKSSDLWFVGEQQERFERAFGSLSDGAVRVPGCMSRKQQVVPRLDAEYSRVRQSPGQATSQLA